MKKSVADNQILFTWTTPCYICVSNIT